MNYINALFGIPVAVFVVAMGIHRASWQEFVYATFCMAAVILIYPWLKRKFMSPGRAGRADAGGGNDGDDNESNPAIAESGGSS